MFARDIVVVVVVGVVVHNKRHRVFEVIAKSDRFSSRNEAASSRPVLRRGIQVPWLEQHASKKYRRRCALSSPRKF